MSQKKKSRQGDQHPISRGKKSRRLSWSDGLLIVIVAVAAGLLLSRLLQNNGVGIQSSTSITAKAAHEKYMQGAYFLDVREQVEYDAYHIPGAVLIPLGQLQGRLDEVPREREIIVVCQSGSRSQQGRELLLQAGYTDVLSMAGGMNAWMNLGYETEQ